MGYKLCSTIKLTDYTANVGFTVHCKSNINWRRRKSAFRAVCEAHLPNLFESCFVPFSHYFNSFLRLFVTRTSLSLNPTALTTCATSNRRLHTLALLVRFFLAHTQPLEFSFFSISRLTAVFFLLLFLANLYQSTRSGNAHTYTHTWDFRRRWREWKWKKEPKAHTHEKQYKECIACIERYSRGVMLWLKLEKSNEHNTKRNPLAQT